MAYTPINWTTGDTITADKLNRCDNGWAVESSSQQLFTETVTTETDPEYPDDPAWGTLSYSTQITADTATVTFDGTDYVCNKIEWEGSNAYGGLSDDAPDFSTIPFLIVSDPSENAICTPTGGTHTVTVAGTSSSIETSPAFETAVNSVVDTSTVPMECVSGVTTSVDMGKAFGSGRILFFKPYGNDRAVIRIVVGMISSQISFIPADSNVTATFDNGVFTVTTSV